MKPFANSVRDTKYYKHGTWIKAKVSFIHINNRLAASFLFFSFIIIFGDRRPNQPTPKYIKIKRKRAHTEGRYQPKMMTDMGSYD